MSSATKFPAPSGVPHQPTTLVFLSLLIAAYVFFFALPSSDPAIYSSPAAAAPLFPSFAPATFFLPPPGREGFSGSIEARTGGSPTSLRARRLTEAKRAYGFGFSSDAIKDYASGGYSNYNPPSIQQSAPAPKEDEKLHNLP